MTPNEHPLFEFDPSPDAIINPSIHRAPLGFPGRAVVCWFGNVVPSAPPAGAGAQRPLEHGDHAICIVRHRGVDVAWSAPGVGAPAAVTSLEVLIAWVRPTS